MFSKPDPVSINEYQEEVKNYNAPPILNQVILFYEKLWLFKQSDPNQVIKEDLASTLGNQIVNIADTYVLSRSELKELMQRKILNSVDLERPAFLTRLAQDYKIDELPLKSLDEAVAGELVFSTLIRRRDPHEYNHSYIEEDIPVFYDHGVSFATDGGMLLASDFFSHKGQGFAGSWRVEMIKDKADIKKLWRKLGPEDRHFIYDKDKFISAVNIITEKVKERLDSTEEIISNKGMIGAEVERITEVMKAVKLSYLADIELMLKIVLANSGAS